MSVQRSLIISSAALFLMAGSVRPASAQGWMNRVKNAAKETVARKAEQGTAAATGSAVDAATGKIKCAVTDSGCISNAKAAGKATILVDAQGNPVPATSTTGAAAATAAPATDLGTDFTPGTRVILAEDFKSDEMGNFPRAFELKSGNMEVANVGGVRYLRITSIGEFDIHLPEVLPEQFTMEFDFTGGSNPQEVYFTDDNHATHLDFRPDDGGLDGPDKYRVMSAPATDPKGRPYPIKIMADGKYVKMYMNGTRVANAPNAAIGRSRTIRFLTRGSTSTPALYGNFRIAAGGKDLYKALSDAGRVTTDGVFFDTGSDNIRPESAPALKQIGDMLAAHGDLKLSIEGHTDNVGKAQANVTLSEKRAAAVKTYLVSKLGVNAARLTSRGFGDTKPVGDNATPDGRQKNRRVELVKQ
jgi:outer membrane protein OmpA-like peptidoglycan-associated protein